MVEHPWMKLPLIANLLGLTLSSYIAYLTGNEFNNLLLEYLGIITCLIFFILFVVYITIAVQDYVKIYSKLDRGIGPLKI